MSNDKQQPTEAQRRQQIDRTVKQLVDGGNSHKYSQEKARELAYRADKKLRR
jgi:hypothetical protein